MRRCALYTDCFIATWTSVFIARSRLKLPKSYTHNKPSPLSLSELACPEMRTKLTGKIEHRLQQSLMDSRLPQNCPSNSVLSKNVRDILLSSGWTRTPPQICEVYGCVYSVHQFCAVPINKGNGRRGEGWYKMCEVVGERSVSVQGDHELLWCNGMDCPGCLW